MRIPHQTGVATVGQFIATASFSFINGGMSVITGCQHGATADCITNAFVSLLVIILLFVALGILLALGYAAQARRSRRLAYILISAELFAALIFLFDAKQAIGVIEELTNFASALLAVWVILVAWKLILSRGGRIVVPTKHHKLHV